MAFVPWDELDDGDAAVAMMLAVGMSRAQADDYVQRVRYGRGEGVVAIADVPEMADDGMEPDEFPVT